MWQIASSPVENVGGRYKAMQQAQKKERAMNEMHDTLAARKAERAEQEAG